MIKRTLYFGSPAYLFLERRQLVVESPGEAGRQRLGQVPVEDVGLLVMDHPQITVTHPLLIAIQQQNGIVLSCDEHHLPIGILHPLYANTQHTEIIRAQAAASLPLKKQLWKQTIKQKIDNQAGVLRAIGFKPIRLQDMAKRVRSGDPDNLEAQAAAFYWPKVFDTETRFYRKREGLPPNNALNYGYAILRALVARALVGSGLHPALGIQHRNKYNPFCLADDIMEPYRPYVDAHVLSVWNEYGDLEELNRTIKGGLLRVPELDVRINGKQKPLQVGVQQTAATVARCFRDGKGTILYPKWP